MDLYRLRLKIKNMPIVGSAIKWVKQVQYNKQNQKKRKALAQSGTAIVELVETALTEGKYQYFLYFGSLLGVIRDGKFIEFDNDVDYGILIDESFSWNELEKSMEKHGMRKVRQFSFGGTITEQTYQYEELTVDLFACYQNNNTMDSYVCFRKNRFIYNSPYEHHVARVTYRMVENVEKITLNNMTYTIPENAEALLEDIYSEGWRIPDPNWKHSEWRAWHELENTIALIWRANK